MSPTEFDFLINFIGEIILRNETTFRKSFLFKKFWHWRYVLINSMTLSPFHCISQSPKRSTIPTAVQTHTTLEHMAGHPRCVFINYIWLNQLSNTTNLWWIDVYYLVINYIFRRLWSSSGWLINKKHISSYIWHAYFLRRMGGGVIGWGYEISCVLGREWGCIWVCIMLT